MRPASLFLKRKDLIDDQRDGAEAEPMQNPFLPAKVQTSVPEDQANQRTFLTRSLSAIRPARRDAKDFHRLQLVCACSGIVVRVS
jgi:hypothetical protein